MADLLPKLLQLLKDKNAPQVRTSALVVLGELGLRDKSVSETVIGLLDDAEAGVREEAIKTVGKVRAEKALPKLLERIQAGGVESELAAQAASCLGERATKALQDLMHQTAPGLRRRIAASLAAGGTVSAESAALETLLDSDPGVVDAAARTLSEQVPGMAKELRSKMLAQIMALLKPRKDAPLSPASEAALIRVMAAFGDPACESLLWSRLEGARNHHLRMSVLQALGKFDPPKSAERLALLLTHACDRDFRVAAPALMLLKPVVVQKKQLPEWLKLLDTADPAARRFALEKLQDVHDVSVAKALLNQVHFHDANLRRDAMAALLRQKQGPAVLRDAILEAEHADGAWSLVRALPAEAVEALKPSLAALIDHACDLLENDDRRADALLHLSRQLDARAVRDRLEEKALALRKKKKYEGAIHYLRLLTRDPACSEPVRFEAAACALKLSGKDVRVADPCLNQFKSLLHRHEQHPLKYFEKAKWLEPEDLFYLGFHFCEGDNQEREFAAALLKLLIKSSPRSKIAKDAQSKLRTAGL